MFFFYLGDGLTNNTIVQKAFYNRCFKRIIEVGYCDMNVFFGKPEVKRQTIVYELELRNSPLAALYKAPISKKAEEAERSLQSALEKVGGLEKEIDDYSEFAIIYYIFKTLGTQEKKEKFTKDILESWQMNQFNVMESDSRNMDLRISNGIIFDNNVVELHMINTINQYISLLDSISTDRDKLFFRGHSNVSYTLMPSLFRKDEWFKNENLMYQELKINCANDFSNIEGHLETLAEMQHYGLPTRLLDITKNPLVALYFACEGEEHYLGEVIIFGIKREKIKYPQSNAVAILSSLPMFTYRQQKEFYDFSKKGYKNLQDFNQDIKRLIQEVRLERPGFVGEIKQEDLRRCLVVLPAKTNRRLEKQEGAFIVCGLLDEKYGTSTRNSIDGLRACNSEGKKIVCIINGKKKFLEQLNSLGINKSKIYPEIDDVADYIKNNVGDL